MPIEHRFITSDEDLIKQLKSVYYQNYKEFLDRMKLLGLELDEIISYVNQVAEKNKKWRYTQIGVRYECYIRLRINGKNLDLSLPSQMLI